MRRNASRQWSRWVLVLVAVCTMVGCDLIRSVTVPPGSPGPASDQQTRRGTRQASTVGATTIYLPRLFDDETLGLQGVTRIIEATDDPAWGILQALIRGPTGEERAANFQYALDRRTRAVGIRVEGGTGTIDFGEGLERVHGRPFSELVYWSIVYTMTELAEIERVALAERGRPLAALGSPPFSVPVAASRADAPAWTKPRNE